MGTRSSRRSHDRAVTTLCIATLLASSGCVYRLSGVQLPSQQHVRIVAVSPETFTIRTQVMDEKDYRVPADGKVTLEIPAYRRGCGPYLLGIRVGFSQDTYTSKTIEVSSGGRQVRKLSLKGLDHLPTDPEGYRRLEVR